MPRPAKPWYRSERDQWCVKIDGKTVVLARGKGGRAEATRAFHALMAERGDGKTDRVTGTTLAGLADLFLEAAEHRVKPISFANYKIRLTVIVRGLGAGTPAETLKPYRVLQWANARKVARKGQDERTLSPMSRRNELAILKTVYRWGVKQGVLRTNPIADLDIPDRTRRKSIMTEEQARRVIAAASPEFRDFLAFLWETGCRPSEAAAVEAKDFVKGRIVMESKTSGRTGEMRIIDLTPEAAGIFARRAERFPDGPIFRNTWGTPWTPSSVHQRFRVIRKALGLGREATAESFRHQFATDALDRGVQVATVAKLLGHTSTKMVVENYSHLAERPQHFADALAKIRPASTDGDASGASRRADETPS